jgi:hypothetical protein
VDSYKKGAYYFLNNFFTQNLLLLLLQNEVLVSLAAILIRSEKTG